MEDIVSEMKRLLNSEKIIYLYDHLVSVRKPRAYLIGTSQFYAIFKKVCIFDRAEQLRIRSTPASCITSVVPA